MFKKLVIDTPFDCVAGISAFLKALFTQVAGNDTDVTALCVIALSLYVIAVCYDFLVLRRGVILIAPLLLVPVALLVLLLLMVMHWTMAALAFVLVLWLLAGIHCIFARKMRAFRLGAVLLIPLIIGGLIARYAYVVIPLERETIHADVGLAFRCHLAEEPQGNLPPEPWRVVGVRSRWLLPWTCMFNNVPSREVAVIQEVRDAGRGNFRLKGAYLWFSTADGSNARDLRMYYYLVHPKNWPGYVNSALIFGFIASAFVFSLLHFSPLIITGFHWWRRQKVFLILGGVFVLGSGAHQWRFLHEDYRMQMVTSRADDGYMMERLVRAHEFKSMDPVKVQNNAYGAVGYYPYAFLSFVTGRLGVGLTVEMLNVWVRGLKMLVSLGMLASVWLLAARHFSRRVALFATILMATNIGFLTYSSFPFYPDVCMAMFSTLALCFMLDLLKGWDERAFFLGLGFAAVSVSIKFLTILLFPFLVVAGVFAAWRLHKGHLGPCLRFLVVRAIAGAALCIAVFFLCNPYLDYNMDWITPNYKMASAAYSVDSPFIVTGAAATFNDWFLHYKEHFDVTEAVAALIVLLGLPCVVWLLLKKRGISFTVKTDEMPLKILWLSVFAIVFQGYLIRSVTLPPAIDVRLMLPVFPLLFVIAAWIVLRIFGCLLSCDSAVEQSITGTGTSRTR